ncbi:SCAN box domain-containing protein [Trichonephila inaurata madagascariensis]|uniref:SCAN box domain-containing protein n=1 Tax=Trichonephila inaurata madagascariensis TaxID=2747483 RepID=A0A8X6WNY4_9ARAC|nr:SCAN box domain-containing protein [Trichonephila inaurata madagascariensis]
MLDSIAEERKSLEVEAIKKIAREDMCLASRVFELEKLKLESQNPPESVGNSPQIDSSYRRQMKLLNVPADFWVSHLIGVIPSAISRLIGKEPKEMFRNYAHIHNNLLQRIKLTTDRFRVLFRPHQKQDHSTWKDFFFELRNFFEGWREEFSKSQFI